MEYEIITGKKVTSTLLYSISEKQLYFKKSCKNQKVYYSCYKKGCKCRLVVENGICEKSGCFAKHEHDDHEAVYDELKALNNIKRKCVDRYSKGTVSALSSIKKACQDECKSNQQGAKHIDFEKIRRGLQYLTSKVKSSPKTPADIVNFFKCQNVVKKIGMSLHKGVDRAPFFKVCHEEEDFSYCIFESKKTIELIKKNIPNNSERKVIIDASLSIFSIECYKQLMVIYIEYAEEIFPFMFVLMTSKSSECFHHIFSYMKANVLNFDGAVFITDYEVSLRNAITAVFPTCKPLSCWFFFCQAMRHHTTTITKELFSYIQQDENAELQYLKLLLLPLLPLDEICKSFFTIKGDIENLDQHSKFDTFLNYYEKQWLMQIGVEELSWFGTFIRISFALEAYNDVLSKNCTKESSFLKFVKLLQREEFNKSTEFFLLFYTIGVDRENELRKPSTNDKVQKIEKAYDDLRMKTITTAMFLQWLAIPKNAVCTDWEQNDKIYYQDEINVVNEIDDKDLVQTSMQISQPALCNVCQIAEPNVEIMPCRHSNTCNQCVLKLQADAIANGLQNFNCPECHKPAEDILQTIVTIKNEIN